MTATPDLFGIPVELRIEIYKQLLDIKNLSDFRSLSLLNKQAHFEIEDVLLKHHILVHVSIKAQQNLIDRLLSHLPAGRVANCARSRKKLGSLKYAHARYEIRAAKTSRTGFAEAVMFEIPDQHMSEVFSFIRCLSTVDLPRITSDTIGKLSSGLVTLRHATHRLMFNVARPYAMLHEAQLIDVLNILCRDFRSFSITGASDQAMAQETERTVMGTRWPTLNHFRGQMIEYVEEMPTRLATRDGDLRDIESSLDVFRFLVESTFTSDQGMRWASSTIQAAPYETALDEPSEASLYLGMFCLAYVEVMSDSCETYLRHATGEGYDCSLVASRALKIALVFAEGAVDADMGDSWISTEQLRNTLAQAYCRCARVKELMGELEGARKAARKALDYLHCKEILQHALRIEKSWRAAKSQRAV